MRTGPHWQKIGLRPHHGICLALSSLRSQNCSGIGEFLDLIPLIDWCKSIGFDCIQLLPLNDSGDEPSPYFALSSCALDPIYLRLPDGPHEEFRSLTKEDRLPRHEVKQKKIARLFAYYQKVFSEMSRTAAYQEFLSQNRHWLEKYALFKALKEHYGDKPWQEWPADAQNIEVSSFHCFLQFLCFEQLETVHRYALEKGIFLKGDIPILLSPDSADVWEKSSLFRLDLAAGAPPDYYNPQGQMWGFPLYNWDEMRRTHFSWWHRRLKIAEKFFDIYRIDHVVGFFRIWAIPEGKKPIEGYFVPYDITLWAPQGREILEKLIDATELLPIAEDLGTIPREVRPILKELGICRTIVIRWARRWDEDHSYVPYSEYEPLSLTTVSTPDTDTLRAWWKKLPDEAAAFARFKHWSYSPDLTSEQLFELLRDAHHTPSYFHINILQEYLSLFPHLVWPNLDDERMNLPGTLLSTNWSYRFRPYLEEIVSDAALADAMRNIIGY